MGIVSGAILVISGVYLALGLMYLRFWRDERARLAYLAFTISCLSYAIYAWFELGMIKASRPEEFLFYAWWAFVVGGVGITSFAWFGYLHLQGRKWLFVTYAAMRGLALVLHLVMANGINFRQITSVGQRTMLGETLSYPVPIPNPWMVIPHLSHVVLIILFLDASVRRWQRGEPRTALIFGMGTLLFGTATLIVPMSVLWGLAPLPLFSSFYILFIVLPMLYELNYDMHRAAMLSEKLEERDSRLSETLEHLQLSAAAGNVGMWTRKVGEDHLWVSEKAGEIWGLTPGKSVSREELFQHIHAEDREVFVNTSREMDEGRRNEFQLDYRTQSQDGNVRWISSSGNVELRNGTRIIRGAIADITKLKLTEYQLTDTLEKLQLAASAGNVGLWSRKIGGEMTWASEEAMEIWGFAPGEQFTQDDIIKRMHPDDRGKLVNMFHQLQAGKTHYQLEYRLVSKDGNIRWIHAQGSDTIHQGESRRRRAPSNAHHP